MRKYKSTIILLVVFLTGFSLLLYPVVSNYINSRHQTSAIASYDKYVDNMSSDERAAMIEAAREYNKKLAESTTSYNLTDEETEEYDKLLDPLGTGMMGSIDISAIGVSLPVYHGISDGVLEIGAGHLPGSSLPVGGESTHCVLSGHRGLPSARLFTDLDQLQNGDVFVLHTLDLTMAYQVDQIQIVEPEEVNSLSITQGEDYCTLVTCTPYGINTQRLLVRGHRIPYDDAMDAASLQAADAIAIDPVIVATAIAIPVLLILLAVLMKKTAVPKKIKPEEVKSSDEK